MAKAFFVPGWPWFVNDQRLFWGMQQIRNAEIATFQPLNEYWARDANNVYSAGSQMRNADIKTFRVLNALYALDANNVYTLDGVIRGADASTFVALGPSWHDFNTTNGYAKDSQFVYHTTIGGKACIVKGADTASFTALGHGYGADESAVYYETKKVPGASPAVWQHVRGPHCRSENIGYVLGRRIRGANGEHLESLPILEPTDYWSRDDKVYYRWDRPSDPEEYLNEFRKCFIFRGQISKASLTWDYTKPLDPMCSDSWSIAQHARLSVDCKEWIQKPDLDVPKIPQIGEPLEFAEAGNLKSLASLTWMNEDRIWIFKADQCDECVEAKLELRNSEIWWEYSSLDQLEGIKETIAAAS